MREGYSAYGLPLGEAFQLRDDVLGLFGDPEATGKANADDVRGHRPTALLAETWRSAGAEDRERLRALMGQRTLNGEELDSVRATMRRLKAPDRVEGMIAARVEEALDALQELNVPARPRRGRADRAGPLGVGPPVLTRDPRTPRRSP